MYRGTRVEDWLDRAIRQEIETYPNGRLGAIVAAMPSGEPLSVKYTSARWASGYRKPTPRMRVSTDPAFTWGTGTYVTPILWPLSSAIFGRVGVVSEFDPTGWQVFDATDPLNQDLYLQWLSRQKLARRAMCTMHTLELNRKMRDNFRINYDIDCVLFRPDQANKQYTDARNDVWMAVTDWARTGYPIKVDHSDRLVDPRISVLIEEEFEDRHGGATRAALLALTSPPARPMVNPADVHAAYRANRLVRVPA